jgi:hypothetical protein
LFSDVLDDGKNFLIMEELRGLARTRNIFPDFCAGLPGSAPAVSPTITTISSRNFGFVYNTQRHLRSRHGRPRLITTTTTTTTTTIIIIIIIIITLQHNYREALEVYRLERGAYKNMATENGVRNTTCTVHTGIIPNELHEGLKLLNLRSALYILMQKAVILNTCRIVKKVLARRVNRQCLVSETRAVMRTN